MRITAFIIILFIITGFSEPVNYEHKAIYKELDKNYGITAPTFTEVPVPDSLITDYSVAGKLFHVCDKLNPSTFTYAYIGRLQTCRAGGCGTAEIVEAHGANEYLDYIIFFDNSMSVSKVRVFNYQATHGHEVTAKSWLKQFIGYNAEDELLVGKNIDSISGATISTYALTRDVQLKMELLALIVSKR